MFNNNGRTVLQRTHSVSRTLLWPQEHTCTVMHTRGNTFILALTHTIMILTQTHTHRLEQSVTASDMEAFTRRPPRHHWLARACVRLYERCRPQHIWPSFRNNGRGEWLVGWASWLREVTGGMLKDMPRMERWSERQRRRGKRARWRLCAGEAGSGVIVTTVLTERWREEHRSGAAESRDMSLMEERVGQSGQDDGLTGSKSGSLHIV